MTLKEIRPQGKTYIHHDGGFLPKSILSTGFGVGGFAIDRAVDWAKIRVMTDEGSSGFRDGINVDDFPQLVRSIQKRKAGRGKPKIVSGIVDTSKNFTVKGAGGVIFEYTYPQKTHK